MRLAAVLGTVLWAMDASAQTQAPEPPKHWDTCLLIAGPTDTTACSDLILSDCADTEAPATCVGKMTETGLATM
ncbi:MAG: hypothetical protein AAF293_15840 [Pseudomonadota bacterium]